MPELPEVETTCLGLQPLLVGRTITAVEVYQPKLRWPVPANLTGLLYQREIIGIERRGKYLLFGFEHGTAIAHLGMSGSMSVVSANLELRKHEHYQWLLDDGQALRYNDPRRFGSLLWARHPYAHVLLAKLGPEPLTTEFDGAYLYQKSRARSVSVKSYIMDSHTVVGVGNIYASESLHRAGISPTRAANKIALKRYQVLAETVKTVLSQAIAEGGTTLRDFAKADGKPGYFAQKLTVYGREGLPCFTCGGLIYKQVMSARATYYCKRCQS